MEIARKRMTNYGLSTSDIDVNSDDMAFFVRVTGLLEELKGLCEQSTSRS